MKWEYPYFKADEMRCHCGECDTLPRDEFMQILVRMREEAAFPFIITSGYRCAHYNRQVANTGENGPHVLGLAADIRVYGDRAFRLIGLAIKHGMTGIGFSQKGPLSSRYIHVDCVPSDETHKRPWIWSY